VPAGLVALGFISMSAALAACASRTANAPPAASPETQPPPSQPLARGPVDPDSTNFPYPYPVQFFELRSQAQTLRMAYLDVPPNGPHPAAPATVPGVDHPAASTPAPAPEAAPATGNGAPPSAAAGAAAPQPSAAAGAAAPQPTTASASTTMSASAAMPGAAQPAPTAAPKVSSNATYDDLDPAATVAQGQPLPSAPITPPVTIPSQTNRCVVLLHGKNFTAANWAPTIEFLSKQGFRVIAPDQIGFGKSSKPSTYQYTFAQLANNTRALMESAGLTRCSIVGHSMGGMLGIRFALQYPAATERLILVNPIGLEDYSMSVPYRTVDEWFADELKQTPDSIREYQRTSYYAGAWRPEYEQQIQQIAGFTLHPDYSRVAWVNALTYDMIFTQPVVHDLPRLRVPTKLIIGTRDRTALGRKYALPQSGAAMGNYAMLGKHARDSIPGSQLVELPGLGHVPQVEAFDQYSDALLRFLR
jgi:pimeloyl-ACP methyl ester carboxylesterase